MHYKSFKSIVSPQNGMNLFRGCTHGCIYCDSRSHCYQILHDFEDIEIKENAPKQLYEELKKRRKKCMIKTGAMTDPYMPFEETLAYTRESLEVIYKLGFGVSIQTKSNLILRDMDLLEAISKKTKCVVEMTLTTFDEGLCKLIEPNVSTSKERFEVLMACKERGIPTVVWLSPFLPFINDTEDNIKGLLDYCVKAGVKGILCFGIGLTLREGNREYFYEKLDTHFKGMKEKYQKTFGRDYVCNSPNNKKLMGEIIKTCKMHGILYEPEAVFEYIRTFEDKDPFEQLTLWNL